MRYADEAAVGLSVACLAHCLLLPVFITLAPWLFPVFLADEGFHIAMLAVAVPVSAVGIGFGFRVHRDMRLVALAAIGLVLMVLGVLQETDALERGLTVIGVACVAAAHTLNWQWRRRG
ncbi:MAG: MerC domain-containing protein [Gammaproteobacteria bacterium]|nr:MAG: MerC domain-containing protein [Gammaproteobacteria bacterium]